MVERKAGTIVNIGSEMSFIAMAQYAAYCASKAGVLGLTRALAAEFAPHVTVNAVCPGPVDTPMLESEFEWFGDATQARAETEERVPLGRIATASEVAELIVFTALKAPYSTGAAFRIDGGTTIA
jgi:NAD(P)-dependent dehydrogenase (short-subunit alcohol dehydrogenase family)